MKTQKELKQEIFILRDKLAKELEGLQIVSVVKGGKVNNIFKELEELSTQWKEGLK